MHMQSPKRLLMHHRSFMAQLCGTMHGVIHSVLDTEQSQLSYEAELAEPEVSSCRHPIKSKQLECWFCWL